MNALPLDTENEGKVLVINNNIRASLKIIHDTLCISYGGGFLPFEDFINTEFLDIIAKDLKVKKEAKAELVRLRGFVEAFSN